MRRRLFLPLLSLALATAPGWAREPTRLAVLGFSEDGSAFAFEQFGWLNGASAPYSELTIFATATGRPVGGSPFAASIVDGDAPQARARSMVYTAASRALAQFQVGAPGTVAARASGDPNDPAAAQVGFEAPGLGPLTLRLDIASVQAAGCEATGAKVKALAIRLLDGKGTVLRTLYKEKNPPPDRQCPTGYAVTEVRLLPRTGKPPVLAVIVGMERPAHGGAERRYLGFTADLALPAAAEAADAGRE